MTSTSHFLLRLIPARPTFPADMTDAEAGVMAEHAAYWSRHMEQGAVVAFGPVADPSGFWGLAVLETGSADAAERLASEDPAITSGTMARFELHAMPDAAVRPHTGGNR